MAGSTGYAGVVSVLRMVYEPSAGTPCEDRKDIYRCTDPEFRSVAVRDFSCGGDTAFLVDI